MLRRASALVGIILLITMIVALVLAVHRHRQRMQADPESAVTTAALQHKSRIEGVPNDH